MNKELSPTEPPIQAAGNSARKVEWLVWGGLIFIIAVIGVLFLESQLDPALPMPVIGRISDFRLTNQDDVEISAADLRGKVWLADVIFTRCPGPCTAMSHYMSGLQSQLPANAPVRLVTFTSDPDYDTPPILHRYAALFNADSNCWTFLTGPKQNIRSLEVNDLKFVVVEKSPKEREVPDDLFIHSTWFVLVDKQGRLRGWVDKDRSLHAYFDSQDSTSRAEIIPAIKTLLKERAS